MARDDVGDLIQGLIEGQVSHHQLSDAGARAASLGKRDQQSAHRARAGQRSGNRNYRTILAQDYGARAVPESHAEHRTHAWDPATWKRQLQFDQQFMRRHPNIVVKAENTPWSHFIQKYLAQAAGGKLPDLEYTYERRGWATSNLPSEQSRGAPEAAIVADLETTTGGTGGYRGGIRPPWPPAAD